MSSAPSIGIVVLCRNHERFVEACLRSIMSAADQPCQYVFVDNGSKDRSVEVARATVRDTGQEAAWKIIELSPERPLCRSLNIGVAATTSDFVKPISSDDMLGPNFFTGFRRSVSSDDRRVGVWLAGSVIIDEHGEHVRQSYSPKPFGMPDDGPQVRLRERHVIYADHAPLYTACSMFYRRATYEDVGGYNERFRYEDRPFLFDVLKRGWGVVVSPYNNTSYRVHGGGISADPAWMAEARLPIVADHAVRAEWRNKPMALYQLARNVRVVARDRLRAWRGDRAR